MPKQTFLSFGCGHLGLKTILLVKDQLFMDTIAATKSKRGHLEIRKAGIKVMLASEIKGEYDHVLVCIPPGENYLEMAKKAISVWNKKGSLILVSSSGVYTEESGGRVTEFSAVKDNVQTCAEQIVLNVGGNIIRFAGLYDNEKGVHLYYQKVNKAKGDKDGYINLIHYDDAASFIINVLKTTFSGQIYLASDGRPLKRIELIKKIKLDKDKFTFCDEGLRGKKLDPSWSFSKLNWKPHYESFDHFLTSHC